MSTTLEEIEAAYIAAKQRVFHSGTRGIATPEQRQAWGQEFRDTIAKVRAQAKVESLRQLAEEFYYDGEREWDGYEISGTLTIDADRIARTAGIETGEIND